MQELDLSKQILDDIIDNGTPFSDALKNVFQTNVELRPLRAAVSSLLGCELRHHLLFTYLTKPLESYEDSDKRYLSLAMANAHYLHHFEEEEIYQALKEILGEEKLNLGKHLLEKKDPLDSIIPDSINRDSHQYLSLRYNVPEWLIHIWLHFGYTNMRKTLRKIGRPSLPYLRVRTSKISSEEVLKNPDFHSSDVENILTYDGKIPLRRLDIFKRGKLFHELAPIKALLDEHKISKPSEALLYSSNEDDYLEKEFIETYLGNVGLNLATPQTDDKLEVTKIIKELGLHNINFFSAKDVTFMDAAISSKQQLIVCAPKSSNFDAIRSTPDFLMHFDRSQLDNLIANQKAALAGCAKYLDDQGTLIYLVTTMNKKEGQQVVKNFLKENEGFSLVNEKQIYPFEEGEATLYYAVLTHKLTAIAPLPQVELPLIPKKEPPSCRAGEQ